MTKFYLAYGSNLNKEAMRSRCPAAKAIGKIWVGDAKLVFRGVADIVISRGDRMELGLWKITPACERALDRYEGVPNFYVKRYLDVKGHGEALIYVMRKQHQNGIYPPSLSYAHVVSDGYRDFGMDLNYLNNAIEESKANMAPDEQTLNRRARQKASSDPYQRMLAKLTTAE